MILSKVLCFQEGYQLWHTASGKIRTSQRDNKQHRSGAAVSSEQSVGEQEVAVGKHNSDKEQLPDIEFVATTKARSTARDRELEMVGEKEHKLGRILTIQEEYVQLLVKRDTIVEDYSTVKERPDSVKKEDSRKRQDKDAKNREMETNRTRKDCDKEKEAARKRMAAAENQKADKRRKTSSREEMEEEEHDRVREEDRTRKIADRENIDDEEHERVRDSLRRTGGENIVTRLDRLTSGERRLRRLISTWIPWTV